ncbi:MAG: Lrp/AsnC family transcriptional regulator, partial [Pseudolabrys sp.]
LDRLILKGRGRNPVRLTNHRLRELGISRETKQYQLRRLEAAGVIKIETQQRKGTVVTHLWWCRRWGGRNMGGVVSGVFNLESSGVSASDWRPRHDKHYHEA